MMRLHMSMTCPKCGIETQNQTEQLKRGAEPPSEFPPVLDMTCNICLCGFRVKVEYDIYIKVIETIKH